MVGERGLSTGLQTLIFEDIEFGSYAKLDAFPLLDCQLLGVFSIDNQVDLLSDLIDEILGLALYFADLLDLSLLIALESAIHLHDLIVPLLELLV